MKSTLFVALIALAISSSSAAKIKGSCPKPVKPTYHDWSFSDFLGFWNVIGRSEETVPKTVANTLQMKHIYPGKVIFIEWGKIRDNHVKSEVDMYMDKIIGDFEGESYYDVVSDEQPYTFNFTTSDGHRGQMWMPHFEGVSYGKYAEAVIASCVKIDASTVDVKTWFVSGGKKASAPSEVKNLMKQLTGQEYISVCQDGNC